MIQPGPRPTANNLSETQIALAAAEAIPDLVWSARPDGHCDYFNGRWYAYTGACPGDHDGQRWLSAVHPEDRNQASDLWAASLESGQDLECELRLKRADGAYLWFLARGRPVRDGAGYITRWFGTCTDIHGRTRAREDERFLADLTDRLRSLQDPETVLTAAMTAVGEYLRASRATYAEIEYEKQQVIVAEDYSPGLPSVAGVYPLTSFAEETMAALARNVPVDVADVSTDPRTAHRYEDFYRPLQIRAFVAVPVMMEEEVRTALTVQSTEPRQWAMEEVALLGEVGRRIWFALRSARLTREARQEAAEREKAEAALRRSEGFYRFIGEAVPDFVWAYSPLDGQNFLNRRYIEYLGFSEEQAKNHAVEVTHHPDDLPALRETWREASKKGVPYEAEFRLRRYDGIYRWFMVRAVPIKDEAGQIVQWIGTSTDIHERKEAEEALRLSEETFRTLVTSGTQCVWRRPTTGQVDSEERAGVRWWTEFTGQSLEESRGWGWLEVVHPEDRENARTAFEESLQCGHEHVVDYRVRRKDGQWRWLTERGVPIRDADGTIREWAGTLTDIHERKTAEEALRAREQELQFIATHAPALISNVSTDMRFVYVNQPNAERFGATADEIIGRSVSDVIGQEAFETIRPYMLRAFAGEEVSYAVDVPYKRIGTRHMHVAYAPYRDEEGKVAGLVGIIQDMTAARRAEEALRESEERFRQLADAMPQMIWTARPDGSFDYYNERWYDYTGFARDGGDDESWEPILHPDDVKSWQEVWGSARQTATPYQIEYRFRDRRTGGFRWFLGRAVPARNSQGEIVKWYGTCTDIDDQKRAEEELRRRQSDIEALNRRLQRAMQETHHRVKNNLQVIAAMVDLQVMQDTEMLPVGEVKRLGSHVRTLATVHDLLTEQARTDAAARHVSARAILDKLLPLLQQTAHGRHFHMDLAEAWVSPRQGTSLALVANELVSNAVKHGKGRVAVTLRLVTDEEGEGAEEGHVANTSSVVPRPSPFAVLEVCDDGEGFPPGFDPSAVETTGIMLVENLSRWDLGGSARYENRPTGGARVVVTLPVEIGPGERR
jgi:PAS domain S-box-containing protein